MKFSEEFGEGGWCVCVSLCVYVCACTHAITRGACMLRAPECVMHYLQRPETAVNVFAYPSPSHCLATGPISELEAKHFG